MEEEKNIPEGESSIGNEQSAISKQQSTNKDISPAGVGTNTFHNQAIGGDANSSVNYVVRDI